jgi:tetratricopeptide (TPR) repeat protein
MRRTPLALLSAALLLLPVAAHAQQRPQQQQNRPPQTQPAPRLAPISLSGRYLAARVGEQDHDYDAAADQLDQALLQTPGDPDLVYGAFRLRLYAGRFDSAIELAPAVLRARPGDGFANLALAVQQIRKGEYKAAEQQLARIGTENQLGVLREYVMAWLKAGEKDFGAARAFLARLKPAAGERAEAPALVIEAQIDEMAGDKAAAEAKYRRAASLDRNGLRTTVAVAEGLRRLGKDADARELLRVYGTRYSDSVVMDGLMGPNAPMPKPPSPASGIAEAVAAYNTAISRLKNPEDRHWQIYFGRGIALERTKNWPKAEADMKKALELSPEQPYVLNYLGYSWIDQGLHLEEGMKMLERATELRPDDGAITDSVGWAYYRLGQFEKAVEWLERAIEQKGDDATITEHLGDAYWHVGRKREARFQWDRSLQQKPDKDRVPIIKDKLENGLNAGNDKPTVYEKAADSKQGG